MLHYIKHEFGSIGISRGNKDQYLGMNIIILNDSRISISIKKRIDETLNMIPGEVKETTTIPSKIDMFEVYDMSQELDQKSVDLFRSIVAKNTVDN